MKNKLGVTLGFVAGMSGFLILFAKVFLPSIPPEDEVPPGLVLIISIVAGILCAFIGYSLENYLKK